MATKQSISDDADLTDDADIDVEEDGGRQVNSILVSKFLRMWPREVFDVSESGKTTIARSTEYLKGHGVYILYRDDVPYYIGQAKGQTLRTRLRSHATNPNSRRYLFWNYFSVYVIHNVEHIDEVEAILISAMPSVLTNGAIPKLVNRVKMDKATRQLANRLRKHRLPQDV